MKDKSPSHYNRVQVQEPRVPSPLPPAAEGRGTESTESSKTKRAEAPRGPKQLKSSEQVRGANESGAKGKNRC
eukprot:3886376-Rhodomonas_salina.1